MAKAIVTLKSGEIVQITPEGDDFLVNFVEDNELELTQASNTRRSNNFFASIRGLFTLDGSQDRVNEEGETVAFGVNFRETVTTNLRGYRVGTGAYLIINAKEIVSVEVVDN